MPSGRILLVDDDASVRKALHRVLVRAVEAVEVAASGDEALERLGSFNPDVVISDYRMPGIDGVELLARVKELSPYTQRILLTGEADMQALEDAVARSEVFRLMFKPWTTAQMLLTVRSALEHQALAKENARLNEVAQKRNLELEARVQERTEALSVAKAEWEMTFDTIDNPMVVLRVEDLVVRRANRAAASVSARPIVEAGQGLKCHDFMFRRSEPCPGCPAHRLLAERATVELQHEGRTWVLHSYPMGNGGVAVCNYRDVTDERLLSRRLLESEKMSAIGSLAGGVAHEINNPLSGILGFAQIMKREAGRSADDLESLQVIEESAHRCKRIVESLLKVSRHSRTEERRLFDLSKCVEETVTLFQGQARRHPRLTLKVALAADLPDLFGDPGQLGQVVLNLLQNALQALPNGEGIIDVQTSGRNGSVVLKIADTGCGISPANLPRIFDPHFTTKPPGEGTGLGLAIVFRIVTEHGGHIDVETHEGAGTAFNVVLPAAPEKKVGA